MFLANDYASDGRWALASDYVADAYMELHRVNSDWLLEMPSGLVYTFEPTTAIGDGGLDIPDFWVLTKVADLVGGELGWTDEERGRQLDDFLALVERQRRAADPAEDAVEARLLHPTGTGGPGGDPGLAPPVPGPDA